MLVVRWCFVDSWCSMLLRRFLMFDVASWCSTSLCYLLFFFCVFFHSLWFKSALQFYSFYSFIIYIFLFIYVFLVFPLITHFTSWNHLSKSPSSNTYLLKGFFYYFWWFSATKRISEFSSSLPFTWSKVLMLNHLLKGSSYFLLLLGSFPGFHGVLLDYCPGLFTIDDNSSTLSEPDTAHTWSLDRSRASETLLHSWR